jgi:hypothetical protein
MLINKGLSAGEVITLKLTSGEELVARLVEDAPLHYRLERTKVVGMGPSGPALMDYLFTVSPTAEIKLSKATVTIAEPTEKVFADQYIQATTGIALA